MVVTRAVLIETERKLTGDGQGRRREPHVSLDRVGRYRVPREQEQGRQIQAEARHGKMAGGRWHKRVCLGIGTIYRVGGYNQCRVVSRGFHMYVDMWMLLCFDVICFRCVALC